MAQGAAPGEEYLGAPGDTVAAATFTRLVKTAGPGSVLRGDGIVVVGPVDLSADTVRCALKVHNSQFLGPVRAEKSYFAARVEFTGTEFAKLDFRDARFVK